MTKDPLPSLFDLTPLNETYRAEPHVLLRDLRERCPVYHDPVSGLFVLTRYADVRGIVSDLTIWRDPKLAEEGATMMKLQISADQTDVPRSEATSILFLDSPDHERIRVPLMKAFYTRIAKFRPAFEVIVDEALARINPSEPFDLMSVFCVPIPIDAIATILGVDHERLVEFRRWSEGVIQGLNPYRNEAESAEMETCQEALNAYFTEAIILRREEPGDDLISDMTKLQAEGAKISDTELRINLGALLVGGNLTTTDLIGNAVRLLLINPSELAKLLATPSLVNSVVEETLRFEPPVDITTRVASKLTKIGGCPVKPTQGVCMSLRAANRDPEVFDNPDRFEIGLKRSPHVAFGGGAHICIGAPLARLEAQVAISKLFEKFPHLKLVNADAPEWRGLPFFRGLERLDVQA
ncbi:MAG: cytochrome P450 [Parvibaculum sp.]|nr:cytochrome P450 [Parvibaculum sp.]